MPGNASGRSKLKGKEPRVNQKHFNGQDDVDRPPAYVSQNVVLDVRNLAMSIQHGEAFMLALSSEAFMRFR